MQKINYEIDGQVVEIEVSDEFAKSYQELELEEKRANEREKWRKRKKLVSLDGMVAKEVQFEDKSVDIEQDFIVKNYIEQGLQILTREQQELINLIYFCGLSLVEVAKKKGISKPAVTMQMQRALKQLKKYFKKV